MTSSTAPVPEQELREPPFPPAVVEDVLKLLGKAVRAHQLYLPNNPTYLRAIELLQASFVALWEYTDEIALSIGETALRWEGRPVLQESEKSSDSLPWLFYKDGIRELRLLKDFEQEEVVRLLGIIQRVRKASPDEDDLLTMLWEQDFLNLRYRYVDLAAESAPPPVGTIATERPSTVDPRAEEVVVEEVQGAPRAGVVNIDDFDTTLYFLEEREIEYLRGEVAKEYASDLRGNVVAMLLDVYELQADRPVREEIATILDSFILHLLSAGQFRSVAYLLRESGQAAQRARDLDPGQRERLAQLADRLSQADSLTQLLQSLDEAAELPPQEDLNELFDQLRGSALGIVLGWLGRTQNVRLRTQLEVAAARLASTNTAELVRLIGSSERDVSIEAVRRAGALRSAAAVSPLARVLSEPDVAARLAAVLALGEIGSAGALQVLERAVEDSDRDVRVASARALGARAHRAALPRLEAAVKSKALREADLTEKMAMFEAYGSLCGDAGVSLLDTILNGKGFLGRREDAEIRACAAMALGRIGGDRAADALRRAGSEKDVLVRNAVNRASRGGTP